MNALPQLTHYMGVVNLSEGLTPQVAVNDRGATSLCKAASCKFIRGMH